MWKKDGQMTIRGKSKFYVDLNRGLVDWIYPVKSEGFEGYINNVFYESTFKKLKDKYPPGRDFFRALESESVSYSAKTGSEYYDILSTLYSSREYSLGEGKRTYENLSGVFRAKELITEYYMDEFDEKPDFSDKSRIAIAYTKDEDTSSHDIQVFADLSNYRMLTYLDNEKFLTSQFSSISEMSDRCLENLSFGELTTIPEYAMNRFLSKGGREEAR